MALRVALSLLVLFLLASPAAAQFTTSDVAGSWTIHALRTPQGPLADPPSWITGFVAFDQNGVVILSEILAVQDYYEDPVLVFPGGLTVSPGGDVTGTLGNASITGQFLQGQGAGLKSVIVGTATSGPPGPDQETAFFILVRITTTSFTQGDATGSWRVKSLQVPGPDAVMSEYVFGRIQVSNEGEITSGSLTSSNGSTSTFISGNLNLNAAGYFGGTLVTSPFGNEDSVFSGAMTPDKGVMVGILTRFIDAEIRLGMFVLQREPAVQYVTTDLGGQWELFSVQSRENPGDVGFGLTGTLIVDSFGNVTDGTIQFSSGPAFTVPDGFLLIDNDGLISGSLFTGAGSIFLQATMLPAKNQIYGVDSFSGEFGTTLGLFTLVKALPAVPASTVQFRTSGVTVTEGTTATFFVDRSGATTTAVSVTYTATPLNAVPGQDFTPVSGLLSFAAGATSRSFTVPTLANTRLDGNRSVLLSLGAPTSGAMLGRDTSLLTILDNDQPGAFRLGAATYTVAESAAALVVTILRAGTNLAGNVSVSLTTSDVTATAGDDYTAVDRVVTFNALETTRTVSIPIVNDTLAEGPEPFRVSLHSPTSGATLASPVTATATITDNDVAGTLKFEKATYSVNESGGVVVLRVLRTGGLAGGVTVDYTTEDRTADSENGDYQYQTGRLTFGAGNTSATITIPIGQDFLAEGNETFVVRLSNPQGGAALGTPSLATVTIVDDESAFQLSAGAYLVKEGVASAVVTIQRSGALVTPSSVTFTASPGTATPGLDFAPVSNLLVSFPPNTASKTVNVPIRNNTLVQGNRTVMLEIGGPTGGAQLGPRSTALLTIQEDDQPGVIRLSAPAYSVAEKAGSLVVRILRAGVNLASNVSVSYATGNGSASAGLDYTHVEGVATFNAGEVSKSITVPIRDDALVEGNEAFTFSIFNPTSGATLATPTTATATIVDDDKGGQVKFSAATYSFSEGAGNASITVVRSAGAAGDVLVDYAFQDVTAAGGVDYGAVNGTLSFGAGQTSATIVVPIFQDLLAEGNETFRITLGNARGGATLVAPVQATVTIVDDESAIQFSQPAFTGKEGTPAVITILRSGALGSPASVTFTASPGTAVPGLDFTPVSSLLVSFPPNTASKTVSVALPNDPLVQGNRTILLGLGAPTGGAQLGTNGTALLTKLDDDQGGVIRLSAATYAVNESTASLLVDILRAGTNLAGNVSIDFATTDGTALANVSYLSRFGTVTFNAGETKKTIGIPILNDAVARGPLSFSLALSRPTGGASLGTPSSAAINVADNDTGGMVKLSASSYRTVEGNGNFSVTVVRSSGFAAGAAVDYTITHGTTSGADLAAASGSLTFAANQMSASIPLPIFQDSTPEGDETFTVTLSNPRGGAALAAPSSAVVTIVDDEVVIQFNRQADGRVKFQGNQPEVIRTGPLTANVSVQYVTTNGTALLGQDYVLAETGTLVFPPNVAIALLPLVIIPDNLAEGPETFTVTLVNPSPPAQLGPDASETFSIFDDDFGGRVHFASALYAGTEGQTVTLTVVREGGLGTVLPVAWGLIGGNASAGADFTPASGVLTFGTTESLKTIVLSLATDALMEGPESAFIGLSLARDAAAIGAIGVTEVRIQDATVPPATFFQFNTSAVSVLEGGTATVTISRTGDLSSTASIEYTTSPGTAQLGSDYSLIGGSITFGVGSSSADVTVDATADQTTEGSETFSITLRNPSANAAIGTPSTVVVTITEPAPTAYTYTVVAEAVAPIAFFRGFPAINNNAAVAFRAVLQDGNESVYTTVPGAPTPVASTADGLFTTFNGGTPLADDGQVAFRAFLSAGGTAVYRNAGDGSALAPVAVPDATYAGFGAPSLSPGGRISFRASLLSDDEAVIGGTLGGGQFTIADTAEGRFAGYGQFTAAGDADNHNVAFVASESSGASGIYLSNVDGEEGVVTQIVDGSAFDAFSQFLTINGSGRVAFLGFPVGGGSGIFLGGNGSALTTLATDGGAYGGFGTEGGDGTPAINDAGTVAFLASLTAGGLGIFTGPDPVADKVISTGDPLRGSTVADLVLGGINGAGQIVFRATLDDERQMVIVATPAGAAPPQADIGLSVSVDDPGAGPVNPVSFTVTVTNAGPAPATAVQVTGGLSSTVLFISSSPSQGSYNVLTRVWTVGTLAPGGSATLRIDGVTGPLGPYTVTAARTASSPADPNAANDLASLALTPASLAVTTEGPLVGVGRTISGQVTLSSPAPAGGVIVTLAVPPTAPLSVAPTSVAIAVGTRTGNFSVTGIAVSGPITITASAPGYQDGTAEVTVTASVISLGVLPTLGLGQSASLPISLSTVAPAGGVTVNFASTDTNVVTVTPSVFIPGGAQVPAANPQVTGVNIGSAQINASATGFAPDARGANVSVNVTFSPTTFAVVVGTSANITVNISAAAPAGGLTLNLVTGNSSVATAVSSVTVPQGQLSVTAAITGVAIASTTLQASGSGVTSAIATITVTAPPAISVTAETVGQNLQTQGFLSLGTAAPAGGLPVTLTSSDPTRLVLSGSQTTGGSGQITVTVGAGAAASSAFWVQALADTGTATMTASAPGYTNGSALVTLQPSGFRIASPGSFTTTTLSGNTSIQINSARLNPGTFTFAGNQQVRGGTTVNVVVTATDQTGGPGVGAMTISPVVFSGGDGAVFTAFDPVNAGTSLVALVTPAGFATPTIGQSITATVNAPAISLAAETVGQNLQAQGSLSLDAPAPAGGLLVTLTSEDPSRVVLSSSATTAGTGQVTVTIAAGGTFSSAFWVQALADTGTVNVTATAPGFSNDSALVTLQPSGFRIASPGSFSTTTFSGTTSIQVNSARLNPGTFTFAGNQPVRGGLTVNVSVTATDQTGGPGVGALTVSPVVFTGNDGAVFTAFDPASAGTSLIALVTPAGFATPTIGQSITATVTAPPISLGFTNQPVGRDLQDSVFISLGATPPSPVTVTVTVTSTAIATVSNSGTVAGGATVTFNNVTSASVGSIFLQGRALGSTTVTAQAAGYADDIATVTVHPSGFATFTGSFTTMAGAANTSIQVNSVRLDPTTLNFAGNQQVRGGLTVNVPVTAVDQTGGPGVGTIVTSPLAFTGGQNVLFTQFDPAVAGTSLITIGVPAGFDTPSNFREITATVSP